MLQIVELFSLRTWKPRGHNGNLSKLSHNIAERVLLCCRHEDTALVLSASNKQSPAASRVDASVVLWFLSSLDETDFFQDLSWADLKIWLKLASYRLNLLL